MGLIPFVSSSRPPPAHGTPRRAPLPLFEAHGRIEIARCRPLNSTELAKAPQLVSTVSRIVTRLEGRGWLERFLHAGDGHVSLLEQTGAGRRVEAAIALARRHSHGHPP